MTTYIVIENKENGLPIATADTQAQLEKLGYTKRPLTAQALDKLVNQDVIKKNIVTVTTEYIIETVKS